MSDARSAVEIYQEAKRLSLARDLAGFAELFADDAIHELPFAPSGIPARIEGKESIRAYLTAISDTPMTHRSFDNMTIYETTDPEVVIAEYDAVGEVTATGQPYRLRYLQIARVRDGQIVLWRDYWNPVDGFRLLGRLSELVEADHAP
jgi:ketosteroid isomerase-like protein